MQNQLYTAEGIGPLLIYLVIFAFWAIAKKVSQLAMKRQGDSPQGSSTMNSDVKEFLEKITGQKLQPKDQAVQPLSPPVEFGLPPEIQAETRRLEPAQIISPPSFAPVHDAPKPEEDLHSIAQTEIGDEIHREGKLTLGKMSALSKMSSMRMEMPSIKLPYQKDKSRTFFRVDIRNRRNLTRGMVERIVLGPPLGMGDNSDDRHSGL